ncbi:hypothetical protein LNP74_30475 [Klebsiella pneumoniae subsp. pneumoniae]|nr:hypothetical protein [Klebsiella pneumoniae subsp. pneumoniae]
MRWLWPARLASSTYCNRIPRSPTARRTLQATELADAIHTHWLYDPVLKGTYPADACWRRPRRCGGYLALLQATTRCSVTTAATLSV